VAKVTPSGSFTDYPIPTPDSRPTAVTAGPDGNLWFIEQTGGKVAKLTTAGAFTEYGIPTPGCPDHIAVGSDGNLWFTVACASNKVLKVTTSGTFTGYTIPTASSWPGGITAGPDGNLWFTEQNANKVAKVTPSGIFTEYTLPSPSGSPTDITTGPDGNLWFTELGGNKIAKITTSGSVTEYTLPSPGWPHGGGSIPPGNAPTAITAGPDGNLWFTEQFPNKVARVTTSGSFTEYAIPTGIPVSQSIPSTSCPHGIAAGPGGYVWFTESCAGKVAKVVALSAPL
jgi:virginiamycin B lyase